MHIFTYNGRIQGNKVKKSPDSYLRSYCDVSHSPFKLQMIKGTTCLCLACLFVRHLATLSTTI